MMKSEKGKIIEETFYFGNNQVTIVNPNHYFPHAMTIDEKEHYFEKNNDLFERNFRDLADASLLFYKYEHSFETQNVLIRKYLNTTSTKVIITETKISYTTINELKRNKRKLEAAQLQTIEKLYRAATSKRVAKNHLKTSIKNNCDTEENI